MQPDPPLPLIPEPPRPLTVNEVASILEAGIQAGAAGNLSRTADTFLATVCAHVLAERLERAGLVIIRSEEWRRG